MSDEGVKKGSTTTEFKSMTWAMGASIFLPVVAVMVDQILSSGINVNPTVMALLTVVGTVLTSLGYGAKRTLLKYQDSHNKTVLQVRELELKMDPSRPSASPSSAGGSR